MCIKKSCKDTPKKNTKIYEHFYRVSWLFENEALRKEFP